MIYDEYLENRETFEIMKGIVLDELKKSLDELGLIVTVMEARVKTPGSLEGKLDLKGYKYKTLSDITDILGARIVAFYSNDVDRIASILEKKFIIDWDNSVDKRMTLESDQFGYLSVHYICQIPEKMFRDPDHPEINEYKFEVQLRTALQHVWATSMHDTGYKSSIEIPVEYTRRLTRLAGLLEIADQEFSTLLEEIQNYRRKVISVVSKGDYEDLNLDRETWSAYLKAGAFEALNRRIASINRSEIQEIDLSKYLEVFKDFGFRKLADVHQMRLQYEQDAYRFALYQLGDKDIDILTSAVGIQNLCLVYLFRNGAGEHEIKRFLDIVYGDRVSNKASATRYMRYAEDLNLVQQ